jgi:hypothetical protein
LEKKWLVGVGKKKQILLVDFSMHAKKMADGMEGLKDRGDR